MGFTIDIEGDLNKRLDEITAEAKQIIQNELYAFGIDTVAMAKNLAPVDMGTLRNLIGFTPLAGEVGILLFSSVSYAAYVEFGTGVFAAAYLPSLPPEVQKYARQFFVSGRGRMPARPYLFPAIETNRRLLINRLKAQIG